MPPSSAGRPSPHRAVRCRAAGSTSYCSAMKPSFSNSQSISRWRKRSRGGTGRYSMWRRWTARSHPRCAASEMTPSTGNRAKRGLGGASNKMGISKDEQAQQWPRGSFVMSTVSGEPNAWTIENVGTKPEFRGSGATQALLAKEIELARAAGFKRAQISIFIGNLRAEKAYMKAGFTFVEEKRAADFEAAMGTPGTRRLARDI